MLKVIAKNKNSTDSLIEKILLHLYDCVDYGFSYRAKKMFSIKEYFDHWKKEIDANNIKNAIRELQKQKLIKKKSEYSGSVVVTLTEKGLLRALNAKFRNFANRKENWDGKWRMVAFDIPEKFRKGRDALRYRFKSGDFYELQNSIFLCPHDCKKEVMALVRIFKLEKFVMCGLLDEFDGQERVAEFYGLQSEL